MQLPLPGETILVGAALLAGTTGQLSIIAVVVAAAAGAIVGDGIGYAAGRRFGLPMLEKYGHYIHLDKDRLLIGRYLFFQYGSVVVFVGRFVAVLRMFAALLAGANRMPWGRFTFFNVSGGICWASSFGFGAHAVGTAIYKISEVFSVIAFSSGVGGKLLLRSTRTQRALNRFASLVFVALAAKLASTQL